MRKLTAGAAVCLVVAGCGGGSSKPPPKTSSTATTTVPTDFNAGYEQAWGKMKPVGAEINATIRQVKRAQARHRPVANSDLAREFAIYASQFEPAVIEFQALTPPPSVAKAYRSMADAAVGVAASLRNFSNDANANRTAAAARDLGNYFAYAVIVDNAARMIFDKLGLT